MQLRSRISSGDRPTHELASGRKTLAKASARLRPPAPSPREGKGKTLRRLHLHGVRPALEHHVHEPQHLLLREELLEVEPLRAVRLDHMI